VQSCGLSLFEISKNTNLSCRCKRKQMPQRNKEIIGSELQLILAGDAKAEASSLAAEGIGDRKD
jgi:hypothetical protein